MYAWRYLDDNILRIQILSLTSETTKTLITGDNFGARSRSAARLQLIMALKSLSPDPSGNIHYNNEA